MPTDHSQSYSWLIDKSDVDTLTCNNANSYIMKRLIFMKLNGKKRFVNFHQRERSSGVSPVIPMTWLWNSVQRRYPAALRCKPYFLHILLFFSNCLFSFKIRQKSFNKRITGCGLALLVYFWDITPAASKNFTFKLVHDVLQIINEIVRLV